MTNIKPSNRIYLTYKARMVAEEKLRTLSKLANLLNIWYSFLMIVGSLAVAGRIINILYFEVLFASASIAILVSSTYLVSGTLERRANDFRECYLELQKIWNSSVSENQKLKRHSEVLSHYPNHSSRDDADMRFTAWWRGASLHDTVEEIKLSKLAIISIGIRKLSFWFAVACVFFAPIWFAPQLISLNPDV